MTNKTCNKCNTVKDITDFYREAGNTTDGRRGDCKTCSNRSRMVFRANNRERYNAEMRDWRKNNKNAVKDHDLRRTYGIGLIEFHAMLTAQGHKCKICGKLPTRVRPLAVDHDHITGKVRGLLCYRCNRDMVVIDDETKLHALLAYKKAA